MKTVVGLYNTVAEASKVKAALASEGYATEHITVIDQSADTGADYTAAGTGSSTTTGQSSTGTDHESIGGKIKNFFSSFTGSDHDVENTAAAPYDEYASSVSRGGALLAVTVPDEQAETTADLLYRHGATDIQNERSQTSNAQDVATLGNSTGRDLAAAGEQVIPVVQEELQVGKREVDRGGVRIYSHMVSRPVSADVTLREERVVVDRRPVDRAATEADLNTKDGVVELTATGEEAVVGKSSRVVEEVLVGKQSSERTEQINDTVRRTEVEVEPIETVTGSRTSTGTTTTGKTTDRY